MKLYYDFVGEVSTSSFDDIDELFDLTTEATLDLLLCYLINIRYPSIVRHEYVGAY